MSPLKKTIIVTLSISVLLGGFVFVLLKKQSAEKTAGHALTFREFLGFNTKKADTGSILPGVLSSIFNSDKNTTNTTANNGGSIVSQFTQAPTNVDTSTSGTTGNTTTGISSGNTDTTSTDYTNTNSDSGNTNTTTGDTPSDAVACSTTDSVIEFTDAEQTELTDLKAQFDQISPNLFNSDDVASIQSDYDNFQLGNQKVVELKNYFETQSPKLTGVYASKVGTPFYNQTGDGFSFLGAPKFDYSFPYNPYFNPAYPTDPNKQITHDDSLVEKLFQLNIW